MKNIKRIYLIIVVIVGILTIVLLSTKALSVVSNDNNEDIDTSLSFIFDVNTKEELTIKAGNTLKFDADIINNQDGSIYYELWYQMINPTVKEDSVRIGEVTEGNIQTSGNINSKEEKEITIAIINNSNEDITVKVGLGTGYVGREILYQGTETLISEKIYPNEVGVNTCVLETYTECVEKMDNGVMKKYCKIVEEPLPNEPELFEGLIPIKWDSNNIVVKADVSNPVTNEWYNYKNKMWANAVMVTSGTRNTYMNASVGTPIVTSDILAYWVWIPRYRYQLFNTEFNAAVYDESGACTANCPQTIDIKFESPSTNKSEGDSNGEWLTHPAFQFGDTKLSGFWVAKFEPTGTASVGSLTVLPGVSSLRNQRLAVQYAAIQNFANPAYLTSEGVNLVDVHMMKNLEWGALAYLSHSVYGKNGELTINNNETTYYTGGASGNAYITNVDQSTTGNVYGIYDMNGNAWEYVMGNYDRYSGNSETKNSGFNGILYEGNPITNGISFPEDKYVDVYEGTTVAASKLGDAVGETAGWYGDYAGFVYSGYPWFIRGGYYNDGAYAGAFTFTRVNGVGDTYRTFRPVLSSK